MVQQEGRNCWCLVLFRSASTYQAFQRIFSSPPLLDRWRYKHVLLSAALSKQSVFPLLLHCLSSKLYNAIYPITEAKRRIFGKPGTTGKKVQRISSAIRLWSATTSAGAVVALVKAASQSTWRAPDFNSFPFFSFFFFFSFFWPAVDRLRWITGAPGKQVPESSSSSRALTVHLMRYF